LPEVDRAVLETASDRYVIVEYLAEGGMGAIYLGKKLGVDGFEKEVVIKQLLPEFTREQKFIDLFVREARLSASLDHNNIVRTVDFVNSGDDYFMVMEYVRGGDLRTLMRRARRRHKRFSPQAAVYIGHEILEALHFAHSKTGHDGHALHLIHRDVSPSNILVSGAGEVKLTDFGIAKASTHRSVFYKVKGKVGYMSPEQARGETVDRRSDLFSLGVVLWELLTGERLFVGDMLSSAAMVYSQKVSPPSSKRPDVPAEVDAVLMKAVHLDARARYQSAEEFQDALGRAASRNRLIAGASEFASHMKMVCGDDPSSWLRLEMLGFEESHAIKHGTAVVSSVESDPFGDSEPHPHRPHLSPNDFQKKELTSVIALRGDDIELISEDDPLVRRIEPAKSAPLPPLRPSTSSERIAAPTPTPTPTTPFSKEKSSHPITFESEDSQASRAATLVRDSGKYTSAASRPTPTGEETLVRDHASSSNPVVARPRSSIEPTRQTPVPPPRGRENTDTVRKAPGRQRLLPLIVLLTLIGIGVALGVAFSGPELDVIDPQPTAPPASAR
jgi:serine/threonine protein kinase